MADKKPRKEPFGRPCRICTHPQNTIDNPEIDNLIESRLVSGQVINFRNISDSYGMSVSSVSRHVSDHLKFKVKEVIENNQVKRAIDVYDEFVEQLDFAKALRLAAREYLSNVNDPLRLSITPKAHEIEVTYFDHNDMEMVNDVMRPKKKTAQLSVILESIYADAQMEPDKFSVKTIDIRKFALDAINTADTCIDKFAKMGGDYTQDKKNPADIKSIAREVIKGFITSGSDPGEVLTNAVDFYVRKHPGYGILEAEIVEMVNAVKA